MKYTLVDIIIILSFIITVLLFKSFPEIEGLNVLYVLVITGKIFHILWGFIGNDD